MITIKFFTLILLLLALFIVSFAIGFCVHILFVKLCRREAKINRSIKLKNELEMQKESNEEYQKNLMDLQEERDEIYNKEIK